ncbi:unnamed protein product [Linum trigynum]|uniref:Uncharacterized protein n=1 Tax=Linum trigynum TaxID=586398 RepID=A0AAV2CGL0_9ROSI
MIFSASGHCHQEIGASPGCPDHETPDMTNLIPPHELVEKRRFFIEISSGGNGASTDGAAVVGGGGSGADRRFTRNRSHV